MGARMEAILKKELMAIQIKLFSKICRFLFLFCTKEGLNE